ncbi:hypothetical protein ABNZ43_01870 [Weissella sp. GP1]|uniref:hypothetical protein n=1 Tax=Weissella confusa TaxID=1583 RepID=UPI0032DBF259
MGDIPDRLREEIAHEASERLAKSGEDAIFNHSTAEYFVTEEYKDNGLLPEDGIEVRPGHVHEDLLRWRNN